MFGEIQFELSGLHTLLLFLIIGGAIALLYLEIKKLKVQVNTILMDPNNQNVGAKGSANKDSSGSISIVFLDPNDRLVQFNYAKSQFRDLISGVKSFKVWHSFKNIWEYRLEIKSKKGEESIFGAFQIQQSKI